MLTIASVLGGVAGYYAMNAMLEEIFKFHVDMNIMYVALCSVAIFLIGISTTSSTIFRAARSNPVDTLRDE
jgi:ABC-type antimicrobial peptide transport system permease subunit